MLRPGTLVALLHTLAPTAPLRVKNEKRTVSEKDARSGGPNMQNTGFGPDLVTCSESVKLQLCCLLDLVYPELLSARNNRAKPNNKEMWKNCLMSEKDSEVILSNCFVTILIVCINLPI